VRVDQNDQKGAIADFSYAIKLQSTKDRFYKSRALVYSKNKEYDKAIADYTKCLEMNPNELNAMLARAECYVDAHRYEGAPTYRIRSTFSLLTHCIARGFFDPRISKRFPSCLTTRPLTPLGKSTSAESKGPERGRATLMTISGSKLSVHPNSGTVWKSLL
jgi:hypothetical protein